MIKVIKKCVIKWIYEISVFEIELIVFHVQSSEHFWGAL